MAGIITHFMACQEALFSGNIPRQLRQLLSAHADWMFLGAACPDLPYAMLLGGQSDWANALHYENTNLVIEQGRRAIKPGWRANDRNDRAKLAWLMGYLSHIIVDVTIHPVIENIVGPYRIEANRVPHRECEKLQDSLLFHELTDGQDITYAEYSDRFDNCAASSFFDGIMAFWKQLLIAAYPGKPRPEPTQWFEYFRRMFDLSDDDGFLVAAFRHSGIVERPEAVVYMPARELRSNHKAECAKYYSKVKLPGGAKGSFRVDVFGYAVDNLAAAWKALYDDLEGNLSQPQIAKNWDLDTGITIDGSNELTYWS